MSKKSSVGGGVDCRSRASFELDINFCRNASCSQFAVAPDPFEGKGRSRAVRRPNTAGRSSALPTRRPSCAGLVALRRSSRTTALSWKNIDDCAQCNSEAIPTGRARTRRVVPTVARWLRTRISTGAMGGTKRRPAVALPGMWQDIHDRAPHAEAAENRQERPRLAPAHERHLAEQDLRDHRPQPQGRLLEDRLPLRTRAGLRCPAGRMF